MSLSQPISGRTLPKIENQFAPMTSSHKMGRLQAAVLLALSTSAMSLVALPSAQAATPQAKHAAMAGNADLLNKRLKVNDLRIVKIDPYDTHDLDQLPITKVFLGKTVTVSDLECLRLGINHYYQQKSSNPHTLVWSSNLQKGTVSALVGEAKNPLMKGANLPEQCNNDALKKLALSTGNVAKVAAVAPSMPVVATQTVAVPQPTTATTGAIGDIKLQGNQAISSEELKPLVANFLNQPLNEENKNLISNIIRQHYLNEGFLVTQALPFVEGNNLTLRIFEGYIDKLSVKNQSGYPDTEIQQYAAAALCDSGDDCKGYPLITEKVERMVGIVSDLPAVANARIAISPGDQVGTTKVELNADPAPSYSGYISSDNYGSKSTGNPRATFGLVGNNWAGIGDQLVLEATLTTERNNTVGQLGYSIPVGYNGWRIGANYSRSEYSLADIFKDLKSYGKSDSLSLWASYPLIRTSAHNLSFRVSGDYSKSKSYLLDALNTKSHANGINLSLAGRITDQALIGRSYSTYGVSFLQSKTTIDFTQSASTGANNTNTRIQYNATRDQHLANLGESGRLSVYVGVNGQHASKELESGSKFSLGGPSAVRAYPSGEAYGDRGVVGTLELRYGVFLQPLVPGFVTFSIFHDHGWKRNVELDPTKNNYLTQTLWGNGVGINFSLSDRFNLRASWAKRGANSAQAETESPSKDSRFWLTGSYSF